jgi:hypothetical protein
MAAMARCEVTVRGPLSRSLLGMVRSRFDRVSTPAADVLVVDAVDQAAVRALLTLLWDADHSVLSLTVENDVVVIEKPC